MTALARRSGTLLRSFGLAACLTLGCVVFALSMTPNAAAQSGIAVLVNDEAITEFDITQRQRFLKLTGQGGASRQSAINELIEESLKIQEAKRLGVTVTEDQIRNALLGIAQRTRTGSVERLGQALSQSGVNIQTLADRFRAEIAWRSVVRQRFQREVRIRDADILAAIRSKESGEEEQKTTQYTLSRIIAVVPANASNALIANRQRDAEKIRANIRSCNDIRSVASAFRDVTVQDVGETTANRLPEDVQKILAATPVGRATTIDRGTDGFRMLVVCDKAEVSGFEAAKTPVESEMRNERGMILARRLLRDLRADALIEYR